MPEAWAGICWRFVSRSLSPGHLSACTATTFSSHWVRGAAYAAEICHWLCVPHSQPQQEQVSLERGQAPKAVAQPPARLELWLRVVWGLIPLWLCGSHRIWALRSSSLRDPVQRNGRLVLNLNHCCRVLDLFLQFCLNFRITRWVLRELCLNLEAIWFLFLFFSTAPINFGLSSLLR